MTKKRFFEKRVPRTKRLRESTEPWLKEYNDWRNWYLDKSALEQEVYELTDPTNMFGYITKRQAEEYIDYAMELMEAEADMVEDGLKKIKPVSEMTKQDFAQLFNEIKCGSLFLGDYKNTFHIDKDWLYGMCEWFMELSDDEDEDDDEHYDFSPKGFADFMFYHVDDNPESIKAIDYDEIFVELTEYAEEEQKELFDPENIVEWCNRHGGAYTERFNRKPAKKSMRESMHRFNRHPVNRRK